MANSNLEVAYTVPIPPDVAMHEWMWRYTEWLGRAGYRLDERTERYLGFKKERPSFLATWILGVVGLLMKVTRGFYVTFDPVENGTLVRLAGWVPPADAASLQQLAAPDQLWGWQVGHQ